MTIVLSLETESGLMEKSFHHAHQNGHNTTQINGKVYIDGYEYKKGKWRKTFKALWHLWF